MGAEVYTRVHSEHRIISPAELVESGDDAPYNWRTIDLGALRLLISSEEEKREKGVLFVNIAEETLALAANDLSEEYLGNCISSIRETGAGICLDNFGNRFATSSHLHSFDWDYIKCDWRPYNRDNDVWNNIVAASNHCYENGVEGILLGVERTEDLYRARDVGFKLLQGFYFGGEI